jgi:MoaF N-terminal domain
MTSTSIDFADTRTWPPLDRLAPGFDGNKAAGSSSVAGCEIVFTNSHGSRVLHHFDATTVEWGYEPGPGEG